MDPSRYEHPALTADDDRPVVIADVEGLEEGGRRPRPKHCRRKGDDDPVNDVDNASRARNVPKSKLAQKSKEYRWIPRGIRYVTARPVFDLLDGRRGFALRGSFDDRSSRIRTALRTLLIISTPRDRTVCISSWDIKFRVTIVAFSSFCSGRMSIYVNPSVNWSPSRRRASLRSSHEVGVAEGGEGDQERFDYKTLTLDLYLTRNRVRAFEWSKRCWSRRLWFCEGFDSPWRSGSSLSLSERVCYSISPAEYRV
ncbi:hypothetical protein B296_00004591 [Ensete ventricosum]|uniref:Uncharacterized protein n=1 Tax=Ensete ventricosum TaxID=4639 RepID=A0A427B2L9_ENSVE|nr:hypothetical protein B296_00004591 [Ensete ventricosum]